MADEFEISGQNAAAAFTLKLHRGEGMTLIAMNWKDGKPPVDFVGFVIEYKEPGGDRFFALNNRIGFRGSDGKVNRDTLSTRLSPIQKFRWVHFPYSAGIDGEFSYRVTPAFMDTAGELSYGEAQEAAIELRRETYPGQLNVGFTRGFVSSQAFVDRYVSKDDIAKLQATMPNKKVTAEDVIATLLPAKATAGLTFVPTHPRAKEALDWMGFEAKSTIIDVLDQAFTDQEAQVRVVAYDLNEPEVITHLENLGPRLKIIIDDSGTHGEDGSSENQAAERLGHTAGVDHVKRQHLGGLQHNKTIVVDSPTTKTVVCGSTNFSWRAFFVQNNNAMILHGANAVKLFEGAFNNYWAQEPKKPKQVGDTAPTDQQPAATDFGDTPSAEWSDLGLTGINAQVAFSPHSSSNALLQKIADDIETCKGSSLFYSLAFLYQTPGPILGAITSVSNDDETFVYGISDRRVGKKGDGLDLHQPDGNVAPVYPAALVKNLPPPFSEEPTGGIGIRMHHKFVVIDFDKPTARVYVGSYNFSSPADIENGENLLLIHDRRIAVSYVIEALRIFDHYHFRVLQLEADKAKQDLALARPPRNPDDTPWWDEDYTIAHKIRDRELFA